jgi:hypothetical protein
MPNVAMKMSLAAAWASYIQLVTLLLPLDIQLSFPVVELPFLEARHILQRGLPVDGNLACKPRYGAHNTHCTLVLAALLVLVIIVTNQASWPKDHVAFQNLA